MEISKNKVVTIDYTLTDDQNNLLDTSEGNQPLVYIQGRNNIIPGLESAMERKKTGDKFDVSVTPADGYGEYDMNRIMEVPREHLNEIEGLAVGMILQLQSQQGVQMFRVKDIKPEQVLLDGNHPLAGQNLHFSISVVDIRNATEEEINRGSLQHNCGGGCSDDCSKSESEDSCGCGHH